MFFFLVFRITTPSVDSGNPETASPFADDDDDDLDQDLILEGGGGGGGLLKHAEDLKLLTQKISALGKNKVNTLSS